MWITLLKSCWKIVDFSLDPDSEFVLITSEYSSNERYGAIDWKLKISAACLSDNPSKDESGKCTPVLFLCLPFFPCRIATKAQRKKHISALITCIVIDNMGIVSCKALCGTQRELDWDIIFFKQSASPRSRGAAESQSHGEQGVFCAARIMMRSLLTHIRPLQLMSRGNQPYLSLFSWDDLCTLQW